MIQLMPIVLFFILNSASHASCLTDTLRFIESSKHSQKEELIRAAYYNDRIEKRFADLAPELWGKELDQAIDDFAAYDKGFDSGEFKAWLSDHAGTISSKEKLGDYLSARAKEFKKRNPHHGSETLSLTASELPDELSRVGKACGGSVSCHEKEIGNWLTRSVNKTCLSKNKTSALRSMITSLALTNAGYYTSYVRNPEDGFAWTLMATNLFWTPILAEIGCRNTLSKDSSKLGKKIDFGQPVSRSEKFVHMGKSYVNYIKLSPLYNATYLAFNVSGQLISGKKSLEDIDIRDLSKQWLSMSLYDATYAVPRIVLITDPLYMKAFPRLRQGIAGKTKNALFTEAIYTPID